VSGGFELISLRLYSRHNRLYLPHPEEALPPAKRLEGCGPDRGLMGSPGDAKASSGDGAKRASLNLEELLTH